MSLSCKRLLPDKDFTLNEGHNMHVQCIAVSFIYCRLTMCDTATEPKVLLLRNITSSINMLNRLNSHLLFLQYKTIDACTFLSCSDRGVSISA